MGGQLATGSSIYMASAGVPAADGAGLSSIKSFSQLLTSIAAMPLAGGTFIGHVLFTDNTYDIGASGATRPRTVYAGTSVITPLLNNTNASALTLGNSTYGVTVPGAATFSGDISMQKATQGYIRAWSENGVCNISIRGVASNQGYIETNIGSIIAIPYSGLFGITAGDGASTPKNRTYDTAATKWIEKYHDGTNGILSTSSGNLNLAPAGGTVAVTGGITASGGATITGGGVTSTAGLKIGSLQAGVGGVWDSAVTPSSTNYAFITNTSSTIVNASSAIHLRIGGVSDVATVSTASGLVSTILKSTNYAICNYGGSPVLWSAAMANSDATYYRTLLNRGNVGTIVTASGGIYGWCSATDLTGVDTNVTGLGQDSAGVVEINNGTRVASGGSYGSLKCAGITASGVVSHGAYTVATLPAAGSNAGKMAQVTDSNVAASGNYGATVAAGGANRVKVFSDGTNWVIA